MGKKELVSIIVPTYKRSNMLLRTLESLLKQSYKEIEIIVIDDNGKDTLEGIRTEKIMKKFIKINKKIKYFQNESNLGACKSRNRGVEGASGIYITFLDDDDEYLNTKIEEQYNFYKETFKKDEGFINCDIEVYKNERYLRTHITRVDKENLLFEALNEKIIGTPTLFMPKSIFEKVNGFKKVSKGQEWYLVLRLITSGYKFLNLPKVLVRVHEHDGDGISNAGFDTEKMIDGLNGVFKIQQRYFSELTVEEQKILKNSHFLKLFLVYYRNKNIKIANKYLILAIKNNFFGVKNIKYIIRAYFFSKELEERMKLFKIKLKNKVVNS